MSSESPHSGPVRLLFRALLALSFGLGAVPFLASPAGALSAATAQEQAQSITGRRAVLKELARINKARESHGLRALRLSRCLTKQVAQPWSRHMASSGSFAHQEMSTLQSTCPRFGWAGENIAYGYINVPTVMRAWMHSEGHRANLLRPQFTHVGLGIKKDSAGRKYWVQDFGG
jgi:uncharacterized protein YkwD